MKSTTANNDDSQFALLVENPRGLRVCATFEDPTLLDNAARWQREHAGDDEVEVDLTAYVEQAIQVGAAVIDMAGTSSDVAATRQALTDATERAVRVVDDAAIRSDAAAKATGDQITRLREETSKALTEASQHATKQMAETTRHVEDVVGKLFGGEDNPVVAAASSAINKALAEAQTAFERRMEHTVATVEAKFDASDPASPIGKLAATLKANQDESRTAQREAERELSGKVDALATKLAEATAARAATVKATSVTPIKGAPFEDAVHDVLEQLVAPIGDGYIRTGATPGALGTSKKGDGVIVVNDVGGRDDLVARVVVEMHNGDSGARSWSVWSKYLDEAARNREAGAALGIVRTQDQMPGDEPIRLFGIKRMVMVFDPEVDDVSILRATILLLRAQACLAVSRSGEDRVALAQEALDAAAKQLAQFADLQKLAGSIKNNAESVVSKLTSLHDALSRHVGAALMALTEADSSAAAA